MILDDTAIDKLYPFATAYVIMGHKTAEFHTDEDGNITRNYHTNNEIINWDGTFLTPPQKIKRVDLAEDWGDREKNPPSILSNLTSIEYLSLGSRVLKNVDLTLFPHLKYVGIYDYASKYSMPTNIVLPSIQFWDSYNIIDFKKENLPNLKSVGFKYNEKTFEEILNYDSLDYLKIYHLHDNNVLGRLSKLSTIKSIFLFNGRMTSIEDLQNVKGLKELYLKNLHQITDISFLKQFTQLRKLQIIGCNKIENWDFLFEMEQLEDFFYDGKMKNLSEEKKAILIKRKLIWS